MAPLQRPRGHRKQYQSKYKPKIRVAYTQGNNLTHRTPRKIKPKSNPQVGKPTIHPYVDPLIDSELENASLFNRPAEPLILSVFPNKKLPCGAGSILSYLSSNINIQSSQYRKVVTNGVETGSSAWTFLPLMDNEEHDPGEKEEAFATFMTGIANSCLFYPFKALCDFSVQRLFTGAFSTRPLRHTDSGLLRKPDILGADAALLTYVLGKLQDGDTFTWPNVHLIIEIQLKFTNTILEDTMHNDLANKVMAILDQQPNRSFVPTLVIAGYEAFFSVWNCAGVVHSEAFNVNTQPELFLCVILGFLFAKEEDIGYDPSITVDPNGCYHVSVEGKDYVFDSHLFSSQMIQGRATWCWAVREAVYGPEEPPKYLVVKDSWPLKDCWPDELSHFQKIKVLGGINGIATLSFFVDVKISPGVPNTTDTHRGVYEGLFNHIHRRIFFEEEGEPIYMFRTKRELIKAFIDYLTAHSDLYFKAKLLHGDISLYNLLLLKRRLREFVSTLSDEDHRGLLVGLDYAYDMSISREQLRGPRGVKTGTPPFMSVRVLLDDESDHTLKDDLESFFYVLVYMCGMYTGPGGQEIKGHVPPYLHQWIYTDDWDTLGFAKGAQLNLPISLWRKKVSSQFQPYWNCLKPCILKLRRLVRGKHPTHQEFIQILQETLNTMPLDDNSIIGDDNISHSDDTDTPHSDDAEEDVDDEGYESPTSLLFRGTRTSQIPPTNFIHNASTFKQMRLTHSLATNDLATMACKKARRI